MRNSPSIREARAFAAATLFLPLSLTPAAAHMATPSARPAVHAGMANRFSPARSYGFNGFGVGGFGLNRLGSDRFNSHHFDFTRFGLDRFGYNPFAANAGGYWGYPPAYSTAPSAPAVIEAGGPPMAINVYGGEGGDVGEVAAGRPACPVVHLLEYDKAGNYAGERQIHGC